MRIRSHAIALAASALVAQGQKLSSADKVAVAARQSEARSVLSILTVTNAHVVRAEFASADEVPATVIALAHAGSTTSASKDSAANASSMTAAAAAAAAGTCGNIWHPNSVALIAQPSTATGERFVQPNEDDQGMGLEYGECLS